MAELKRKEDELTTADLAGMSSGSPENKLPPQSDGRHESLRNESLRRDDAPVATIEAERNREAAREGLEDGPAAVRSATEQPVGWDASTQKPRDTNVNVADTPTALFAEAEVTEFRSRWGNIQAGFVDEPRAAVENADNLVASLMKKLAEGFAHERENLEKQWDRGDNVSTEDLRVALQRYRSFFDRLLKV